jgi:hypothetical protein
LQANNTALNALNQELVKRKREGRKKATKKPCGTARVLTIEDSHKAAQEKEAKEAEVQRFKEKKAALRGVIG